MPATTPPAWRSTDEIAFNHEPAVRSTLARFYHRSHHALCWLVRSAVWIFLLSRACQANIADEQTSQHTCSSAVFVIDRAGTIAHAGYVRDQLLEPDYDAALQAVRVAADR